MLHIVIMIGRTSGGLAKHLLNNPEYLRKIDRENGMIYVAPYFDDKFFHREIIRPKLDENGYMKSAKMDMRGQSTEVKFTWENGRIKTQTMSMMGQEIVQTYNYDENGIVKSNSINFGGQAMDQPFSDYKFDEKGNWISRKTSMMGQEMTFTRTIEYY